MPEIDALAMTETRTLKQKPRQHRRTAQAGGVGRSSAQEN